MKRPLLSFSIAFILGAALCKNIGFSSSLIILLILLLILSFAVLVFRKAGKRTVISMAIVLLFFSAGVMEFNGVYKNITGKFADFAGKEVTLHGYFDSEPEADLRKTSYVFRVSSITDGKNTYDISGRILVNIYGGNSNSTYEYGKKATLKGKLEMPKGMRNPGGFDYAMYLAKLKISAIINLNESDVKLEEQIKGNPFKKAGLAIKQRIIYVVNKSLPRQQAALLNGMLIGEKKELGEKVEEVFSDAGLTHIMAVSGANIAFIILPFAFVFKKIGVRQPVANSIIILILILFVFVTGFSASVVRAVIMAIILLMGGILKRESDIVTSMAFAALILAAYNPLLIFDVGFQLSFAATISLVLIYKKLKERIKLKHIPEIVTDTLLLSLSAQIGVLPITAFYFNKISLISIFSNILVAPTLQIITILGSVMAVVGQFSIKLSGMIGYINTVFLSFILFVSKISAQIPYSTITVTTPSVISIILYYTVIAIILYKGIKPEKIKPKYCFLGVFVLSVVLLVSFLVPKPMEVVFLDVGQGDSIFIRTYSGKTVLIDGGGYNNYSGTQEDLPNTGEDIVVPFLLDQGVKKLDLVVATHGHEDHIQGLSYVLQNMGVRNFAYPDVSSTDEFNELLKIAEEKNVSVKACKKGDRILLDDKTVIEVLHPEKAFYIGESTLNNGSLVLKLTYKNVSILFTGDIEKEGEEILLRDREKLLSDVLKVAHHGSDTSSTEEFLEAVNPKLAVVSVGKNNFGHPSTEVIERLKDCFLFRTDENGAIVIKTYGNGLKIKKTVVVE